MIFLENTDILMDMSQLVSVSYVNKNGNKSLGKLWLLGENECIISDCNIATARNGNKYIMVEFKRNPAPIYGLKGKVSFTPHIEFFFDNKIGSLCAACGHELGVKPTDMDFNTYFTHVKRRVDTFIGNKLKVVVSRYNELRTDKYGDNFVREGNYIVDHDVYDNRMRIESFHHIEERVEVDWNMLKNIFYGLQK